MPVSVPQKRKLGQILVDRKVLTSDQLERALAGQATTLLPLGSTVIRMELAQEIEVALALSEQWGVPGVHLSGSTISTKVLSVVPQEVAASHRVLPLAFEGQSLHVAVANPGNKTLLDEIAFASGKGTLPFVAPRVILDETIVSLYQARSEQTASWVGPRSTQQTPHLDVLQPPPNEAAAPPPATPVSVSGVHRELAGVLDQFPDAPKVEPRAEGAKPRVLAVDDEPDILDIIEKALSHRDIEVVRATRGREALELLRTCQPDLVLLDAMLPEIHGFEICSKIKKSQQFQHIPVIMISAIYTGWNFIQDVKRIHGADEFIEKPFRVVEMVRKVEEMLARSQRRPPSRDVAEAHVVVAKELKQAAEAFKQGQMQESVEAARRAVKADPLEARAHFMLGTALHRAGGLYEAISEFERVVELAPGQFNALKSLAVLYERQGFKAKAVEMWMRALDQSPSDAVRQTIKAHLIGLL